MPALQSFFSPEDLIELAPFQRSNFEGAMASFCGGLVTHVYSGRLVGMNDDLARASGLFFRDFFGAYNGSRGAQGDIL